jgi:hypothetical protein
MIRALVKFVRDAATREGAAVVEHPRPAAPTGRSSRSSSTASGVGSLQVATAGRGASLIRVDVPRDVVSNCGHADCPCQVLAPRCVP